VGGGGVMCHIMLVCHMSHYAVCVTCHIMLAYTRHITLACTHVTCSCSARTSSAIQASSLKEKGMLRWLWLGGTCDGGWVKCDV